MPRACVILIFRDSDFLRTIEEIRVGHVKETPVGHVTSSVDALEEAISEVA